MQRLIALRTCDTYRQTQMLKADLASKLEMQETSRNACESKDFPEPLLYEFKDLGKYGNHTA
jgi:hypothetical protein